MGNIILGIISALIFFVSLYVFIKTFTNLIKTRIKMIKEEGAINSRLGTPIAPQIVVAISLVVLLVSLWFSLHLLGLWPDGKQGWSCWLSFLSAY